MHVEIDNIDRNCWDQLITQFDDASIYQTWSYGTSLGRDISHIVLWDGLNILGCCQAILRPIFPYLNLGFASVKWGPLCKKKGEVFNSDVFFTLMRAIKNEYGIERGYLIRIEPIVPNERKESLTHNLISEGYKKNRSVRPYRTFKLDLSLSLGDLRDNFLQKWRNCLNKAERSEITILEGTNDDLFSKLMILANEMAGRKNLTNAHLELYRRYRRIQEDLPEPLKMKIFVGAVDDEPVGAAICSVIGDTGIYLLGATGQKGLKLNSSYLLQWRMIQWLKEKGVRYYDLGAFNPQLNPGVYHFKLGVAGKRGWEELFLGHYVGCFNLSAYAVNSLLNFPRSLNDAIRAFRQSA